MFFTYFAVKLGHFIINDFLCICNKHASLTAKIKERRKKISFIGSATEVVQTLKLKEKKIKREI